MEWARAAGRICNDTNEVGRAESSDGLDGHGPDPAVPRSLAVEIRAGSDQGREVNTGWASSGQHRARPRSECWLLDVETRL